MSQKAHSQVPWTAVPLIHGKVVSQQIRLRERFTPLRKRHSSVCLSPHLDPHLASRLTSIINHGATLIQRPSLPAVYCKLCLRQRSISMCLENAFRTTCKSYTLGHSTGRSPISFCNSSGVVSEKNGGHRRHLDFVPTRSATAVTTSSVSIGSRWSSAQLTTP